MFRLCGRGRFRLRGHGKPQCLVVVLVKLVVDPLELVVDLMELVVDFMELVVDLVELIVDDLVHVY